MTWIFSASLSAMPLTESDIPRIIKLRTIEHLLFESYLQTDQGLASVLGYHFDTFWNERWYFGTAILGAVGGNRGGYGIAAFGIGYRHPLTRHVVSDVKVLVGSGGGGGLRAGGGFGIEGMAGLGWELTKNIFLDVKYGFLTFPSGTFSTGVWNVGISYQANRLFLPYP